MMIDIFSLFVGYLAGGAITIGMVFLGYWADDRERRHYGK